MSEKKISTFQFRKISRDSLKKENSSAKSPNPAGKIAINSKQSQAYKPKTAHDLIRDIGDKNYLSMKEKFDVIDFVFKKDHRPVVICHACGNKVSKYYVSHSRKSDLVFCTGCYQSLPQCCNCGIPTKQQGPKLSTVYCQFCRVTKACDCCDTSITGRESNRIPFVKGTYCHSCFTHAERCIVCKTPIKRDNDSFAVGGKLVCLSCHKRKITVEDAYILNEAVIRYLNKTFEVKETIRCDVKLINYTSLNPPHHTETLGSFLRVSDKTILALFLGITKERAIGIFAYEYGKYLIKRLNSKLQDSNVINGFSLWVKSFILSEYSEIDEVSEIKSFQKHNPILKSLFNIEKLGGIQRIAEKIREGAIGKK